MSKHSTPEKMPGEKVIGEIEAVHKTQAFKKLWNYYLDLIETAEFQVEVKRIRKKHGIPEEGQLSEPEPGQGTRMDQIELIHDVDTICTKFGLDAPAWDESISAYIIWDEIQKPRYATLFYVADIPDEKADPWSEDTQKMFDLVYPIALRISPYASQRDILDYVKKCYRVYIQPEQEKYKKGIKIGKTRTKRAELQARNRFIYENRKLPRKQIWRMVRDKFGEKLATDYGNIGKIISNEKRRRKEV